MTILLQGSNCRSTVQSGFMHLLLFIVEPFLQTLKAPRGPIILVFSSAYYATLPQSIDVAQARDAMDCTLSASDPWFAVLTLTVCHVGPIALQHLHNLSSPERVCPEPPEKTNKYDKQKRWFCQGNLKSECAALMKSAAGTQKVFHSDLQTGRMILCLKSTNSSKFQTGARRLNGQCFRLSKQDQLSFRLGSIKRYVS